MRLPYSKVYRAFPELDRFTDAQCEEYVRQVRRRFRQGRLVQGVLRGAVTFVMAGVCFVGCILAIVATGDAMDISLLVEYPAAGATMIAVLTAMPSMLFLFGMKNLWLRRRIRDHMKEIRCARCGYAMLGLTVKDGAITCPECGERVVLESLGLTAADVMGGVGDV